jgi:hypothetical protein
MSMIGAKMHPGKRTLLKLLGAAVAARFALLAFAPAGYPNIE